VNTGQVVAGRYELEELLGRGGMSSVFRAHDRVLERKVALKILHERFSGDPTYVERFRREALAIARLSHPNIVTVIDRGDFEGRQYIVFEAVSGPNLKELLAERCRLPSAEALALVHQAARGLAFAHEQGIVHRDVKPQNVLVDADGVAKVTDFGLVRSSEGGDGLTLPGTVLGTSDYLAPEGATGGRADARSDQYALGALLYELLTGEVPYPADSAVAAAARHVRDPVPSVRAKRPDVSPRIDGVVRRAMAKRPEDRFPSTDALVAALEACLAEERTPAPPEGDFPTEILRGQPAPLRRERARPRRRAWRLVAALAVLAVGAGAIAALATGRFGGGDDAGGRPAATPVRLRAVADRDPFGDDSEHPELLGAATDRNLATFWRTETYEDFRKEGVGIVLDAGRPVELSEVVVRTDAPGFTARIEAGTSPSGEFEDVSGDETVAGRTVFHVDTGGAKRRYYLLWITDLDQVAHVNEVRAR
jgi:eukaryotic-like serine/threonine-protein kinase